jgi:hypothetical protein
MNLPTLAAILGHANTQMTMRHVHPAAEEKRRAVSRGGSRPCGAKKSRGHYKSHHTRADELMWAIRMSLKNKARPERFELPTLRFEALEAGNLSAFVCVA